MCGSTDAEEAGFIEYDEDTNTWSRLPTAPVNSGPHAYDHQAINALMTMDANGELQRRADSPISLGVFGSGGRQVIDPVSGNLQTRETFHGIAFMCFVLFAAWRRPAAHSAGTASRAAHAWRSARDEGC